MNKREDFHVFIKNFLIYFSSGFSESNIVYTLILVVTGFSFSDANKYKDFYNFLIDMNSYVVETAGLYFIMYPLLIKIVKFRGLKRTPFPIMKFNFPNTSLGIIGIVSFLLYINGRIGISVGISIFFILLFIIDGDNTILQAIISFIGGIGLVSCHLYNNKEYTSIIRSAVSILTIFICSLYLLLHKILSNEYIFNSSFYSKCFHIIGFIVYENCVRLSQRVNHYYIAIGFAINFALHYIETVSSHEKWFVSTSKKTE